MNFYRRYNLVILESAHYHDPLDALRRFIPTPVRITLLVGVTILSVTTNDLSLVPEFPAEVLPNKMTDRILDWKLVRDVEARGSLQEPLRLISGPLTVVTMGPACLLGVDRERGELLCFIGADIDSRTFQEVLFPLFCSLSIADIEAESLQLASRLDNDLNDA